MVNIASKENETWKLCEQFPNYAVSSESRVYSMISGKILVGEGNGDTTRFRIEGKYVNLGTLRKYAFGK
jgi:hypothetical protein